MTNYDDEPTFARQDPISAIRARLADITPPPWIRGKWPSDFDIVRQAEWTPCGAEGHDDCMVAQMIHDVALVGLGHDRAKGDAEFIAHAPTDVAALLKMVDAAQRLRGLAEIAERIIRSEWGEDADEAVELRAVMAAWDEAVNDNNT